MAVEVDPRTRGSRRKVYWDAPEGQRVKITERQKEIMDLFEKYAQDPTVSNIAQKVADDLEITPNAVYVARRRVKETIGALGNGAGSAPSGPTFRRKVSLDRFKGEQNGVDVEEQVQEVAQMIQGKLTNLQEAEDFHNAELEKIARAKRGLSTMLQEAIDKTD